MGAFGGSDANLQEGNMHVRLGRLCALAAGVLLLGIWAGAPTSAGAADVVTGCTTADPPPQVLDVAATDVVVRRG